MLGLRERGDTIVEVLISIAVISLILVAAYATTRHNTSDILDTQEHAVALKLAESQLEALNAAGSIGSGQDCFVAGGGVDTNISQCNMYPDGTVEYQVRLAPLNDGLNTYKATVTWQGISNPNNSVSLYGRPEVIAP